MVKFYPTVVLTSGSTDLSTYYDKITGSITATTSVPEMTVHMMKSAPTDLVGFRSPILLTVDGVPLFRGIVDDPTSSSSKKEGLVNEVKARGIAARWLDTFSSIHMTSSSAQAIMARILQEYTNRKGSADPDTPLNINDAPSNLSYPIFQRRESIQDMFMNLAQLLAAPQGYLGGHDVMYDFFVDANGKSNFAQVGGSWAGGGQFQANDGFRTLSSVEVRGTPVKNDIWLLGGQTSGRLPLEMQADYQGIVAPRDVWTENTAGLFGSYPSNKTTVSVSGAGQVGIGQNPAFGSYAIKLSISAVSPWDDAYLYMRFPISGQMIGQEPGGGLNCFNEAPSYREKKWDGSVWTNPTGMSEQMGEIQGIGFYLFATQNFSWWLEVVDGYGHQVQNEPTAYTIGGFLGLGGGYWYFNENQAFGPSAQWKVSGNPGYGVENFDWSNVAELRWHFGQYPTLTHIVWLDGLRFIKPLVVHYPDYGMSGGSNPYNEPWTPQSAPNSFRSSSYLSTDIQTLSEVDNWKVAKRIAAAMYQSSAYPQTFWTIEGFGVTNIIPGQLFLWDTNQLCLRENKFTITKDDGFSSVLTAVGPYKSGKWSNDCLADYGQMMKELSQPINKLNKSVSGS